MRTLLAPDVPASLLVDVEVVDSSEVDGGADDADDDDDCGEVVDVDDGNDDDVDDDGDGDEVDDADPGSGAATVSGLAEDINL